MENIIESLYKNFVFQASCFAPYAPDMNVIKNDSTIITTNIQDDTFNVVLEGNFTQKNVKEKIKEAITIFKEKRLPFSWWIGPNDSPLNLKENLISKGFVLKENDYGMYLNLDDYISKDSSKLKIKQVSNIEELKEFNNIHVQSFGNSKAFDIIFSKIPFSSYQGKASYRFFTGYFNKKPVSTGVLVFHANVVGIYYIVTLQKQRKKRLCNRYDALFTFRSKK